MKVDTAQKAWDEAAETYDQLQERLDLLIEDFEDWITFYHWERFKDDYRHMNEQWVMDGVELIFDALKAVGVNAGVDWWWDMQKYFWAINVGTLERKREVWLYHIIRNLNELLTQLDPPVEPFFELPEEPPSSWEEPTKTKDELIQQIYDELGVPPKNSFFDIIEDDDEEAPGSPTPKASKASPVSDTFKFATPPYTGSSPAAQATPVQKLKPPSRQGCRPR